MQFPEEYIKMCRVAGEVQGLWVPAEGDWILNISAVPEPFLFVNHRHQPDEDSARWELLVQGKTDHLLWLPLQHQLQEMVDLHKFPYLAVQTLNRDFCGGKLSNLPSLDSMEQLWLAYVMYSKFNKSWDGNKWVKERNNV